MQKINAKKTGVGTTATLNNQSSIDLDRLEYPKDIANVIGLRKETISFWKRKGCPFVGRKTTVRWVRQFMLTIAGGGNHGIA